VFHTFVYFNQKDSAPCSETHTVPMPRLLSLGYKKSHTEFISLFMLLPSYQIPYAYFQ